MDTTRQTAEKQQKDQQQLQLHKSGRAVEADKPSDENVEAFLSSDENTADVMSNSFSILQQRSRSSTGNKNEHGGFCFKELCSFRASNTKVLCCHFSSEGKFLASAGHEKKAMILRGDDFEVVTSGEGHTSIITDLRFKPKSSIFATSSFDRTVQIWDATRPIRSLLTLKGHAEQVTSLDFHPRKVNLMCSCDRNDQIFLWNVDESACTRISKGASRQVRFQPQAGNFLAAASGNAISLIDVETNSQLQLKGHVKDVRSICWDTTGKYIAAVSEDSAQIWSTVSGGNCIHEFHSNGNKFESCTFHPGYSQMLVIGCYKALELWSPTDGNKTMTVDAHDGIISALADSPSTETIASASHDNFVKLWK
ncbi:hypothetical protein RJ639_010806 [Escallonia herrerae]|uniref:Uncharacterized protein n=1 Tax=Escallonia herrerae TaxID=1293975 RepID=A0AA88VN74_9ASTE|nr:hypothetical protein RJ639_010806 [Escallonia herrerae]